MELIFEKDDFLQFCPACKPLELQLKPHSLFSPKHLPTTLNLPNCFYYHTSRRSRVCSGNRRRAPLFPPPVSDVFDGEPPFFGPGFEPRRQFSGFSRLPSSRFAFLVAAVVSAEPGQPSRETVDRAAFLHRPAACCVPDTPSSSLFEECKLRTLTPERGFLGKPSGVNRRVPDRSLRLRPVDRACPDQGDDDVDHQSLR